jgi:hypothetical protein
MNAKAEIDELEYLAGVRLSELGYRRYIRFADSGATPAELKQYIERAEARELTMSMLVRCAPLYNQIQ